MDLNVDLNADLTNSPTAGYKDNTSQENNKHEDNLYRETND